MTGEVYEVQPGVQNVGNPTGLPHAAKSHDWRNIVIALIRVVFGEEEADACEIACSRRYP